MSVNWTQPLNDMNTQPLEHLEDRGRSVRDMRQYESGISFTYVYIEHCYKGITDLSDNLIGALYEDLHGPPVVISHPI